MTDVIPLTLVDQEQLPFLSERFRQRIRAAIVAANLAFASGSAGNVPGGGTVGQYPRKNSATDFDIVWATPAIGEISGLTAALAAKADLASPALTGIPTAPTAAPGTNSAQISTTAFVQAAIAALVNSSPAALDTLNELATALGNDPNFATSMATALGLKAPLASPALTGTPTAPTAAPGTNSTQLATTAFVAAVAALLAPLASPTFTGTPAGPTAAPGTNTTQLATTAFVAALGALKANLAGATFTGAVDVAGPGFRSSGNSTFATGTGVEIFYSTLGIIVSIDRSTATFKDLNIIGNQVFFRAGATTVGSIEARGFGISQAGLGFLVKEGANCKQGVATLVAGTVVVANTSVTANSRIFLTVNTPGGTVGSPYVSARVAGTSFTITSTNAADTSTVAYEIFEPQ